MLRGTGVKAETIKMSGNVVAFIPVDCAWRRGDSMIRHRLLGWERSLG